MKEQLISFETAKLSKEKGFDWETFFYHGTNKGVYDKDDLNKGYSGSGTPPNNWNRMPSSVRDVELYSAPTQSLVQKWLREKCRIYVESQMYIEDGLYKFNFVIKGDKGYELDVLCLKGNFPTYEKALEEGLQEALKTL